MDFVCRSVPATGETGEIRSIKLPIPPLFTPPLDNLELLSSFTHLSRSTSRVVIGNRPPIEELMSKNMLGRHVGQVSRP
jgi:hypothetical protein